ncbi:MAG TPA: hypothetical protein VFX21_10870, partial [Acidimicrobiia bacterium]|nr:hypothetical protein [Acidimicrobiia bacterium]
MVARTTSFARRGRALTIASGMLVVLGLATALPALGAPAAFPGPANLHRDIDDYVLFAYTQLNFKGGNGQVAQIDGDVGVNEADPDQNDGNAVLNICQNGKIEFVNDAQLVGDSAKLDQCTLGDLFVNTQLGSGTPTINGSISDWGTPIIQPQDLPVFPSFQCNNDHKTVAKNGSLDLLPGAYGNLDMKDGATLTLHAGTYTFCDFKAGKKAAVETEDATVVQIAGELKINNGDDGDDADAGDTEFGSAC